jgi:hypothetical protein
MPDVMEGEQEERREVERSAPAAGPRAASNGIGFIETVGAQPR